MQKRSASYSDQVVKVGQGITYRFNNFKNKQVLKAAEETKKIKLMLKDVKTLIRRRDQLLGQQQKLKRRNTSQSKSREMLNQQQNM